MTVSIARRQGCPNARPASPCLALPGDPDCKRPTACKIVGIGKSLRREHARSAGEAGPALPVAPCTGTKPRRATRQARRTPGSVHPPDSHAIRARPRPPAPACGFLPMTLAASGHDSQRQPTVRWNVQQEAAGLRGDPRETRRTATRLLLSLRRVRRAQGSRLRSAAGCARTAVPVRPRSPACLG